MRRFYNSKNFETGMLHYSISSLEDYPNQKYDNITFPLELFEMMVQFSLKPYAQPELICVPPLFTPSVAVTVKLSVVLV